ncbi:MAG: very short patch repair endonuclease [Acidimicrobiales bacterium]|nr:very short patch repair endonuclease [Acidimicrobiales bacterium]
MGPEPDNEAARTRMQKQPRRDTVPELALRRELYRRGLRYRVDVPPITGMRSRADLVFPAAKVAVFVDGCFWHACPEHGTQPNNNSDWWRAKLEANRSRDRRIEQQLEEAGWLVLRIWEHENPAEAADRVQQAVQARKR